MENTPSILQSKKFLASALASLISFFSIREGFTVEQVAVITGPLVAFIAVQGVADFGKERAKVEAASQHQARLHATPSQGNRPQ